MENLLKAAVAGQAILAVLLLISQDELLRGNLLVLNLAVAFTLFGSLWSKHPLQVSQGLTGVTRLQRQPRKTQAKPSIDNQPPMI